MQIVKTADDNTATCNCNRYLATCVDAYQGYDLDYTKECTLLVFLSKIF